MVKQLSKAQTVHNVVNLKQMLASLWLMYVDTKVFQSYRKSISQFSFFHTNIDKSLNYINADAHMHLPYSSQYILIKKIILLLLNNYVIISLPRIHWNANFVLQVLNLKTCTKLQNSLICSFCETITYFLTSLQQSDANRPKMQCQIKATAYSNIQTQYVTNWYAGVQVLSVLVS